MKVVFSGGGGVGKTTFIEQIKPVLGDFEVIPDFIDNELKRRGYTSPRQLDDRLAREVRLAALEKKLEAEKVNPKFLSDKGAVDYLAYWLLWTMMNASQEENDRFLEKTRRHARVYDLVIIPPFGRFNMEDNEVRSTSVHHQFRVHSLIKGLYAELGVPYLEYALDLKKPKEEVIQDLGIK